MKIENLLVKAKVAGQDIDEDWYKKQREKAVGKLKKQYEKLDTFPTQELKGSPDEPWLCVFKPIDEPRNVEIEGRKTQDGKQKIDMVLDIEVLQVAPNETLVKTQKYSLWFNTAIEREYKALTKPVDYNVVLAYYGRYQKGKKPATTDPYVFRMFPE